MYSIHGQIVTPRDFIEHATRPERESWCTPLDGRALGAALRHFRFPPEIEELKLSQQWVRIEDRAGRDNLDYALHRARSWGESAPFLGLDHIPFFDKVGRLQRAFTNIELGYQLLAGHPIIGPHFRLDPCITSPDCLIPEAVWVFWGGRQDPVGLKRSQHHRTGPFHIGVNLHWEEPNVVASFVNIQGNDQLALSSLRQSLRGAGVLDRWSLSAIRLLMERLPPEVGILRGLPCERHPSRNRVGFNKGNSCMNLYDRSFRAAGWSEVSTLDGDLRYFELIRPGCATPYRLGGSLGG